ncbi:MAG TPA: acyl-CoA dehydrogenase [Acidimicrobiales bacterium]|nr:acyl-CoA dehydrogenase [Acidimicrobiales bacterium]
MDVDRSDEQDLFVQTSERFMETTWPITTVRDHLDRHGDAGADYWRKAAELGWFALLVAEADGGGSVSEDGVHDAALLAYTRGPFLQPGPFVGTNVVAATLSASGSAAQRAEVLPALIAGEAAATWAAVGSPADQDPAAGVRYSPQGDGYTLSGSKVLVQDADRADWLLVTASGDGGTAGGGGPGGGGPGGAGAGDGGAGGPGQGGGPAQFLLPRDTPGLTVTPRDGLDLTRRFCDVTFDGVAAPASAVVGRPGADSAADVERQLQLACVLTAAESVGAMRHDVEMATQYAKDRIAFGRPIGSFQAVKHLLADTSLLVELSTGLVDAAARAVGAGDPAAGQIASMTKAYVGDAGVDLVQNCFQVFGGIGYTWEHDQHLYLRRLTTDAALYGDPAWHRERLCQLAGL